MTTISSGISGAGNWGGMPPRTEGRGGKPDFSKIDADGSGGLDQSELQSMLDKGPGGAWRSEGSAAASGAGSSGSASSATTTETLFAQLDSDGDGSISETELDTGMKPPGHGGEGGHNAFAGMGMDTQGFAAMMGGGMQGMGERDSDSAQQALFSMIDGDSSGALSTEELSSFQDKMKALFEQMQQMGAANEASSGLSLTA